MKWVKQMAKVKLPPQEYLHQCFDYDPDTGVLMWRKRPREHFDRDCDCTWFNGRYAQTRAGWVSARHAGGFYLAVTLSFLGKKRAYACHRVIWKLVHGEDPSALVDHADGDGLNNRIVNLRAASLAENMWNSRARVPGQLKGVTRHKPTGKWQSAIRFNKRRFYLGLFATQEEAHAAYCARAAELHGDFANDGRSTDGGASNG